MHLKLDRCSFMSAGDRKGMRTKWCESSKEGSGWIRRKRQRRLATLFRATLPATLLLHVNIQLSYAQFNKHYPVNYGYAGTLAPSI